jgi:hypothetical protein
MDGRTGYRMSMFPANFVYYIVTYRSSKFKVSPTSEAVSPRPNFFALEDFALTLDPLFDLSVTTSAHPPTTNKQQKINDSTALQCIRGLELLFS